ncbi:hypothetical protein CAEBREN_21710 [Caenorhabditis brenneri]|uniref:Serpentine receptor class gamma n=1 Tax=Caenorhabditis brenneri TaxID=135651 RepID=G0M8W4_CAEBE|nr:hypothetical protein CAEBREN_21710 [Caenorhabditis brenneri]
MSIHRISSILFYNHYERFWSRYYFLVAVMFFIYSWIPQVLTPGVVTQMTLVNGTTLYFTYDWDHMVMVKNRVYIFSIVYFLLLVGIGISVAVVARQRFQRADANSNVSKKLTKVALTYGFVYSGILMWNILDLIQTKFDVFPEWFWSASVALMSLASDLMTLALPYILLIYDSNIKRDLRPPKDTSNANISVMIVSS